MSLPLSIRTFCCRSEFSAVDPSLLLSIRVFRCRSEPAALSEVVGRPPREDENRGLQPSVGSPSRRHSNRWSERGTLENVDAARGLRGMPVGGVASPSMPLRPPDDRPLPVLLYPTYVGSGSSPSVNFRCRDGENRDRSAYSPVGASPANRTGSSGSSDDRLELPVGNRVTRSAEPTGSRPRPTRSCTARKSNDRGSNGNAPGVYREVVGSTSRSGVPHTS